MIFVILVHSTTIFVILVHSSSSGEIGVSGIFVETGESGGLDNNIWDTIPVGNNS